MTCSLVSTCPWAVTIIPLPRPRTTLFRRSSLRSLTVAMTVTTEGLSFAATCAKSGTTTVIPPDDGGGGASTDEVSAWRVVAARVRGGGSSTRRQAVLPRTKRSAIALHVGIATWSGLVLGDGGGSNGFGRGGSARAEGIGVVARGLAGCGGRRGADRTCRGGAGLAPRVVAVVVAALVAGFDVIGAIGQRLEKRLVLLLGDATLSDVPSNHALVEKSIVMGARFHDAAFAGGVVEHRLAAVKPAKTRQISPAC